MMILEGEIDRVLTLLRHKIRERGYTQLDVQKELGWGRSYISQLLTKQKALRVEQVLLILRVIGIDPAAFFGQLYPLAEVDNPGLAPLPCPSAICPSTSGGTSFIAEPAATYDRAWHSRDQQSLSELRSLVRGLVGLLADKEVIDLDDLTSVMRELSSEERPKELETASTIKDTTLSY